MSSHPKDPGPFPDEVCSSSSLRWLIEKIWSRTSSTGHPSVPPDLQDRSIFFTLPVEIRLKIYMYLAGASERLVLTPPHTHEYWPWKTRRWWQWSRSAPIGLLTSCKRIHNECAPFMVVDTLRWRQEDMQHILAAKDLRLGIFSNQKHPLTGIPASIRQNISMVEIETDINHPSSDTAQQLALAATMLPRLTMITLWHTYDYWWDRNLPWCDSEHHCGSQEEFFVETRNAVRGWLAGCPIDNLVGDAQRLRLIGVIRAVDHGRPVFFSNTKLNVRSPRSWKKAV